MRLILVSLLKFFTRRCRRTRASTFLACCASLGLVLLLFHGGFHVDDKITVAIVDEHHEVIPYWFQAVDHGELPKNSNTLIHIDAHSDGAPPSYLMGYPFFTPPADEDEMRMLMQRNDVFIRGAVMSGLVSRVIWIWPSWDTDQGSKYERTVIHLGWFTHEHGHGLKEPHFCSCADNHRGKEVCSYFNDTAFSSDENDIIVIIPAGQCKIARSYVNEDVNDRVALEKTDTGEWLSANESIILDIDEDFFGVESGIELLLKVGVSSKLVKFLNRKLQLFICMQSVRHEEIADKLIKDCISSLMQMCNWSTDLLKCNTPISEIFQATFRSISEHFKVRPSMFCGKSQVDVSNVWSKVLDILYHMYPDHLRALIKTGFCLVSSPETFGFEEDSLGKFMVCHGMNTPNETVVLLRTLSTREFNYEMSVVFELLKSINLISPPKIVTVARSVRDGYTPRSISSDVEKRILYILSRSGLPKNLNLIYDRNLLGGVKGWQGRYQPSS